tara:strand:- start:1795 stop:2514 length:720 start_codon:yes stop_codon:yes gene_type:complete
MIQSDIDKAPLTFLSDKWTITVALVTLFIFMVLFIGKKISKKHKEKYAKILAIIMLGFFLTNHLFLFYLGKWDITKEIPIHLCSITGLICCFIMFLPKNKRQFLFEFLFYCGIIGGIQAILTPFIDTYGDHNYFYIQFFFKHAMIIAFPIYLRNNLGMKLTKFSWLKTWMVLNILVLIIIPLNKFLDSNYMYLSEPPGVKNPMVIGEWPIYIYWWEIFVLILILILFFFCKPKTFEKTN